jgi:CRP-like cAMP-binding protein
VSQEKKFKKGDKILNEGDTNTSLFVVQSGKVSLYIVRGEQRVEIDQIVTGQIIGEQAVFGFPKSAYTAEAMAEVKTLEIPLDPIKMVFDKSPAVYKLFVKSIGDDIRRARTTLKSIKMDQDNAPCPYRFLPRLCAILTLVGKNSGTKPKVDASIPAYKLEEERAKNPTHKDTDIILSFNTLKIFTARMFLESTARMQGFCELLGKLGYISLRYEKNEDSEQMELMELRIHDSQTIELFGEFYQHNFFKAGKSEVIHVDKTAVQIAGALNKLAADEPTDRNGSVKLDYQKMLKDLKDQFFIELKETHLNLLEKKGLYVKRQTVNEVVYFSFDKFEFSQTFKFWQIIQEVDRWNEKGFVDVNANYNEYKKQGPEKCPGCQVELKEKLKFCGECGMKLAA